MKPDKNNKKENKERTEALTNPFPPIEDEQCFYNSDLKPVSHSFANASDKMPA